jgi:hypothetical protein
MMAPQADTVIPMFSPLLLEPVPTMDACSFLMHQDSVSG